MTALRSFPPGRWPARCAVVVAVLAAALPAHAQLFPDNEARKAIVDLRAKVNEDNERLRADMARSNAEQAKASAELAEQLRQLRMSLVDLNAEIEKLRGELARQRGTSEQLARDLAEVQRQQRDLAQGTEDRLRRFEPQKVTLDGREFLADPAEQREYEQAMAAFRNGDFAAASTAFGTFVQRHPGSGYTDSARFWQGNALYGKRDHAQAIAVLREFVAKAPNHPRAPEAMLAIANAQVEAKDAKGARTTLTDLQKAYPRSEAAAAAKDRLAALR